MKTLLNTNAWIFKIALSEQTRNADTFISRLALQLQAAEKMAALAKAARHQVLRYKSTYETWIKTPESKKRRAVIEKKGNLCANYYAAAEAFAHHGKETMELLKLLEGLMPALIADGEHDASIIRYRGRMSNAVLCSRLILSVPEVLERLASEFNMATSEEAYIYVATGNSELSELACNLWEGRWQHRFDSTLSIPFVPTQYLWMTALEERLAELDAVLAKANAASKELLDAKARCFNPKWEHLQSNAAEADLVEFQMLLIDYAVARWSLENSAENISKAWNLVWEALKAAEIQSKRAPSYPVVRNNLVAAKCSLVAVEATRRNMVKQSACFCQHSALDEKTGVRNEASRLVWQAAFENIPAVHRMPSMRFLDNPTRK